MQMAYPPYLKGIERKWWIRKERERENRNMTSYNNRLCVKLIASQTYWMKKGEKMRLRKKNLLLQNFVLLPIWSDSKMKLFWRKKASKQTKMGGGTIKVFSITSQTHLVLCHSKTRLPWPRGSADGTSVKLDKLVFVCNVSYRSIRWEVSVKEFICLRMIGRDWHTDLQSTRFM